MNMILSQSLLVRSSFAIITTHVLSIVCFRGSFSVNALLGPTRRATSSIDKFQLKLSHQTTGSDYIRTPSSRQTVITMSNAASDSVGLQDIGGTDPVVNDSLPDRSWKSRIDESIAKSRKIRGGNFVQLATVDEGSSEPRCRTVVFRGFVPALPAPLSIVAEDGSSCVMKMITDGRSNKVKESSIAELVWWFSKTSEQYRVRGKLVYVGDGANEPLLDRARKEQWGNLSEKAREQFFWKEPGLPYESESNVPIGGRNEEGVLLPPPATFLLVLLLPSRCEYLRLTDNYRQIDELKQGVWQAKRVNP